MMRIIKFLFLFLNITACNMMQKQSVLKYVDPTIGGVGVILQPTRPTVHLPNQMVRVFPLRNDQLDDRILNFPLTNVSYRLYSVFGFLPLEEEITPDSWHKWLTYDNEINPAILLCIRIRRFWLPS